MGKLLAGIVAFLPGLMVAILLIAFGWVIGLLAMRLLNGIFKVVKFDKFLKEHDLDKALWNLDLGNVLAHIVYYYIIILALQAAFQVLTLPTLAAFMTQVISYLPSAIGGVIIFVVAALIGEFIKQKIIIVGTKSPTVVLIGRAVKALVIYLGLMMALDKIGFRTTLPENLLLVVVSAGVFGIAVGIGLACGIAFGLAGQETAKDWIKEGRKRLKF